jgi:hypothetical protein
MLLGIDAKISGAETQMKSNLFLAKIIENKPFKIKEFNFLIHLKRPPKGSQKNGSKFTLLRGLATILDLLQENG